MAVALNALFYNFLLLLKIDFSIYKNQIKIEKLNALR